MAQFDVVKAGREKCGTLYEAGQGTASLYFDRCRKNTNGIALSYGFQSGASSIYLE